MEDKLTIYCDGGARGNPGPAASAFVVMKGDNIIYKGSRYIGESTNNVAEYNAVLLALKWLEENGEIYVNYKASFVLDSELVVKQLNGLYKIKDEKLKKLAILVKEVEKNIKGKISYTSVARNKNRLADFLVNKTLDESFQFHDPTVF